MRCPGLYVDQLVSIEDVTAADPRRRHRRDRRPSRSRSATPPSTALRTTCETVVRAALPGGRLLQRRDVLALQVPPLRRPAAGDGARARDGLLRRGLRQLHVSPLRPGRVLPARVRERPAVPAGELPVVERGRGQGRRARLRRGQPGLHRPPADAGPDGVPAGRRRTRPAWPTTSAAWTRCTRLSKAEPGGRPPVREHDLRDRELQEGHPGLPGRSAGRVDHGAQGDLRERLPRRASTPTPRSGSSTAARGTPSPTRSSSWPPSRRRRATTR